MKTCVGICGGMPELFTAHWRDVFAYQVEYEELSRRAVICTAFLHAPVSHKVVAQSNEDIRAIHINSLVIS